MGSGASANIAEALGDDQEVHGVQATVGTLSVAHHAKMRVAQGADFQKAICDDGHCMVVYTVPCSGFCCERCGEDLEEGSSVWRCDQCDGITIGACCSMVLPPVSMEPCVEIAQGQESSAGIEVSVQEDDTTQEQFVEIKGPVELQVYNMAGFLCDFQADATWTIKKIKDTIAATSEVESMAIQSLICDSVLLEDEDRIGQFGQIGQGNVVCLTVMKRSELQVEWLRKIRSATPASTAALLVEAPPEVRGDRVVVLAAVARNPTNLRLASDELKADAEVILVAMKHNPLAFSQAAPCLRADRDFVLKGISMVPDIYRRLPDEMRADYEIARIALQDGTNLLFAPDQIVDDADLIRLAIKRGFSYQRARPPLRNKFWVAHAVVCDRPEMLHEVPSELKEDRLFALNLVMSNGEVLRRLPRKHMEDAEIVRAAKDAGFKGAVPKRRPSPARSSGPKS